MHFGTPVVPDEYMMNRGWSKGTGSNESCSEGAALRNSGHVGRVGEWAEMAADAGLVSTHHVNAPASLLVAPYGAIDRRFSTAPYACGVPRKDGCHLILDFATSVVAEGKVLVASQGGKPLPENALVGEDGSIALVELSYPADLAGEACELILGMLFLTGALMQPDAPAQPIIAKPKPTPSNKPSWRDRAS